MAQFVSGFTDLIGAFSEHQYLDDAFDRANRIYAPVILMVSASLLGLAQFFGDPIECTKVNADATADSVYIKAYCWAHGTYDIKTEQRLAYYPWVPVVLALQAFFFQLPYLFWASLSQGSGLNLPSLMKGAFNLTEVQEDSSKRVGYCQEVSYLIDAYFKRNVTKCKTKKSWKKKSLHNLTACYFTSKVLYLINMVVQLLLLNKFLYPNRDIFAYAFQSFSGMLTGNGHEGDELPPAERFPLLAKCKFYNNLKDFKNPERQAKEQLCALPLNLYNDKVFSANIIMLLVLILCMVASIVSWSARLFIPSVKEANIVNILKYERQELVERFMRSYLRTDGMLVLKLIRMNMGVNTATEIVENLFKRFKDFDDSLSYDDNASIMTHEMVNVGGQGGNAVHTAAIYRNEKKMSPV